MRPRVFPAEDVADRSQQDSLQGGFNEAAGIPRGRPWSSDHGRAR